MVGDLLSERGGPRQACGSQGGTRLAMAAAVDDSQEVPADADESRPCKLEPDHEPGEFFAQISSHFLQDPGRGRAARRPVHPLPATAADQETILASHAKV